MKRALKKTDLPFEIGIDKLVYGGAGLGRRQGKVVFVPFSTPGDRLLVRPVEEKKNFIRATVVRTLDKGPSREEPQCPYFKKCGGCQWQHIEYSRQLAAKRQILEEIFHHQFPETRRILISMRGSPRTYEYRSRARIQLRGSGAGSRIGFYQAETHRVEDIERCPLFRPTLNEALSAVRQARLHQNTFPGVQELELSCSEEERRWQIAETKLDLDEGFSAMGEAGEQKAEESLLQRRVGEFSYALSASTFFQANDFMTADLAESVRRLWRETGRRSAMDLFCGVGLFTLPLAQDFREVVAVEISPLASRLCARNAAAAGLSNVRSVCADVSQWMNAVGSISAPGFDLIVLDPTRAGAGPEVMKRLTEWAPETIIYVSCDPHTLSRDVSRLPARDYKIDFIEGLDLFPQTYHFEIVLRLKRR